MRGSSPMRKRVHSLFSRNRRRLGSLMVPSYPRPGDLQQQIHQQQQYDECCYEEQTSSYFTTNLEYSPKKGLVIRKDVTCDGIASPTASGRRKLLSKRVVFVGVPIKLRPTASNLRPMERVVRKKDRDGASDDALIIGLSVWDSHWRSYLQQFYTDTLMLKIPSTVSEARRLDSQREVLDTLSKDLLCVFANSPYCAGAPTLAATHDQMASPQRSGKLNTANLVEMKLRARELFRERIVAELVRLIGSWIPVEHDRWYSGGDMSEQLKQTLFCSHVERIDIYQRKFKSVGDGIRRLRRKHAKLLAHEMELDDFHPSINVSYGGERTKSSSWGTGRGEVTPHPGLRVDFAQAIIAS